MPKKTKTVVPIDGAVEISDAIEVDLIDPDAVETDAVEPSNVVEVVKKRKRNRPDLKNFGAEFAQKGDNSRFIRHALATYNLPPIDISDEKQVAKRIDWYFNHCLDADMKPTVKGLCNSLGISRPTLKTWYNEEYRSLTHSALIKKAYNFLEELWEDYMISGKCNVTAGIFLGRNNWGYQDRIDVVVTPNNPLGDVPDAAAIRKQIESLPEPVGLLESAEED